MSQRSAVLLVLMSLCGCAQSYMNQNVILTRQECAEGKKWACDILPEAENDAAQEQADNAARAAGALAIIAANAAASAASAHPQPAYVVPAPTAVTTTCQQFGTTTTCTSR